MTLKSMTAFGSGEAVGKSSTYRCEIRSLNSRFCDISIKMPRYLIALEPQLINRTKERVSRGKIDIFIDVVPNSRQAHLPELNVAAVQHYLEMSRVLEAEAGPGIKGLSVYEFLRLEGILDSKLSLGGESVLDLHQAGISAAVEKAFDALILQRQSEGAALGEALQKILEGLAGDRSAIASKRETIQKHVYENYRRRLDRLLLAIEETGDKVSSVLPEERILSEVAILIDRSDIEEELTRLSAHEQEFKRLLAGGEEVGRRMDFLCQEMQREVNTISNKLTQLEVAQHTLSLKQAVERLRQQIQNIE